MRLIALELRNYRNYRHLQLEPGSGLNLFLGANGQGKTNLLEAVALLALSSSPRARRDLELIGPIASEARVEARVESGGRNVEIGLTVIHEAGRSRRRITVDGATRRALDLPGVFRVALFWPDDLDLIKGGPDRRRRLLNQMLVQIRTGYARALAGYSRVLEQRNRLLKQVAALEQPASALDVWDQELCTFGGELVAARRATVGELAAAARAAHAAVSGGEVLDLVYEGPPAELGAAIARARALDIARGISTVGPHRDDLSIMLDGRDGRAYASQGQQRTAVVAIKLAEARVMTAVSGETPVLLLDDVLSELDQPRRHALLERVVDSGQVVVTSVEAEPFPPAIAGRALVRRIEAGQVLACA